GLRDLGQLGPLHREFRAGRGGAAHDAEKGPYAASEPEEPHAEGASPPPGGRLTEERGGGIRRGDLGLVARGSGLDRDVVAALVQGLLVDDDIVQSVVVEPLPERLQVVAVLVRGHPSVPSLWFTPGEPPRLGPAVCHRGGVLPKNWSAPARGGGSIGVYKPQLGRPRWRRGTEERDLDDSIQAPVIVLGGRSGSTASTPESSAATAGGGGVSTKRRCAGARGRPRR